MADALPDLVGKVRLDTSDLEHAVGRASKAGTTMGSAIGSALGTLAGVGIAGVARGLVGMFRGGLGELKDYQTGLAQTEAVLKSTAGASGMTAKGVNDLAGRIQAYSGQTDDSIVASENMLLTFTNIKNAAGANNDIFTQATKVTADMAVVFKTDAAGAAIQLGKALNDPVKGVSALQRVGVTFTEAQKHTIKSMVDTGNTMGAQKVILAELNKEFGGSAKAYGETMPGQLARSKRAFEDVEQSIVAHAAPALAAISGFVLQQVIPALSRLGTEAGPYVQKLSDAFTHDIVPAVQAFAAAIAPVVSAVIPAMQTMASEVLKLAGHLTALAGSIPTPVLHGLALAATALAVAVGINAGAMAAWSAVTGVAAGIQALFTTEVNAETGATSRGTIASLAHNVATIAGTVAKGVAAAATAAWTAAQWLLNAAMSAFGGPLLIVIVAVAALAAGLVYAYKHSETFRDIVNSAFTAVKAAGQALASFVTTTIPAAFQAVKDKVGAAMHAMGAALSAVWDAMKSVVSTVLGAIKTVIQMELTAYQTIFTTVWNAIKAVVATVLSTITGAVHAGLSAISDAVTTGLNAVRTLFTTVWNALAGIVETGVRAVLAIVGGIGGRIVSGLGNLGGLLVSAGGDLLRGLADGIGAAVGGVVAAATAAAHAAVSAVKSALGIGSPSRVMMELGGYTAEGFALGIAGNAGMAQRALGDMVALPTIPRVGLTAGVSGGGQGSSSGAPAAGGQGDTYHVTVNMDASQIGHLQTAADFFDGLRQNARALSGASR